MIVSPTALQLAMTLLRIRHKTVVPIWASTFLTFILGLVMAIMATIVSTHGYVTPKEMGEPYCAIGAVTFVFLGTIITSTAQPLIGIIGGMVYKTKPFQKN